MIIIIMGKTASGKDTVCNLLCKKYAYEKVVTYTTRPMRYGEVQGESYNFVSNEEFEALEKKGFFLETKAYASAFGVWKYGSPIEALKNGRKNKVIILSPSGVENFLEAEIAGKVTKNYKVIYIYANKATIKKRLLMRGDNTEEANRRILSDDKDFKSVTNLADRILYNNDGEEVAGIVKKIVEIAKKKI